MALQFVGISNISNTIPPGALTPHASTVAGDFMLFFHYSAVTTDGTVTSPTGFTDIINSFSANNGLMCVARRVFQAGDTTFTPSVTLHTTGTSGESCIDWIATWRDVDPITPIGDVTTLQTIAAHTTNWGPLDATSITSVPVGAMMYIFAGRHDDLATVAQTTLTGDGLTWTARTIDESTTGADAATATQTGLNATGSAINPAASYTITGHGSSTSATGTGCFFVVNAAPEPELPVPNVVMAPPIAI